MKAITNYYKKIILQIDVKPLYISICDRAREGKTDAKIRYD